jgi:hypothetical protein
MIYVPVLNCFKDNEYNWLKKQYEMEFSVHSPGNFQALRTSILSKKYKN